MCPISSFVAEKDTPWEENDQNSRGLEGPNEPIWSPTSVITRKQIMGEQEIISNVITKSCRDILSPCSFLVLGCLDLGMARSAYKMGRSLGNSLW